MKFPFKRGLYGRLLECLVLYAASALCASSAAFAGTWDKLPDGRVIIQVKNVRLALPAEGADTDIIAFFDRHQVKNRMTLKDVVVEPDLARKLFSDAKLINVSIPNLMERNGLYVGKFPRSDFHSFEAGLAIGEGAAADCQSWTTRFTNLRAGLAPDDSRAKPSGWAEFEEGRNPRVMAYVRPPSGADRQEFFLGISCDRFNSCGSTKCLGSDVSVSYQFYGKAIEQKDWRGFELKAYDLFKYVLIELVK